MLRGGGSKSQGNSGCGGVGGDGGEEIGKSGLGGVLHFRYAASLGG